MSLGTAFASDGGGIGRSQRLFASPRNDERRMFAFFSSRLGCLGSIIVSVIGTILLILIMRML